MRRSPSRSTPTRTCSRAWARRLHSSQPMPCSASYAKPRIVICEETGAVERDRGTGRALFLEGHLIDHLEFEGLLDRDPDVVLSHQPCEFSAVDEHKLHGDIFGESPCPLGEAACRHKDATVRLGTLQCSDESLQRWALNRVVRVVPLCLHPNEVQPERI